MNNPVMYVVINGSLEMSPGKAAAQAVHAAMLLSMKSKIDFVSSYKRTVIVLEAKDATQIQNLCTYLDEADVDTDYYIDEGMNEVDAFSTTALAAYVGNDEELRSIFEQLPPYFGHATVRQKDRFGFTKRKIKVPANISVESWFAFNHIKNQMK